jgi:hypothetical protein
MFFSLFLSAALHFLSFVLESFFEHSILQDFISFSRASLHSAARLAASALRRAAFSA